MPNEPRPPIKEICYTREGNPHEFIVGRNCTEIREVQEYGEYAFIPWVEVWNSDKLLARFCQHNLEYIFYEGAP